MRCITFYNRFQIVIYTVKIVFIYRSFTSHVSLHFAQKLKIILLFKYSRPLASPALLSRALRPFAAQHLRAPRAQPAFLQCRVPPAARAAPMRRGRRAHAEAGGGGTRWGEVERRDLDIKELEIC